jgi:hypothetical protein
MRRPAGLYQNFHFATASWAYGLLRSAAFGHNQTGPVGPGLAPAKADASVKPYIIRKMFAKKSQKTRNYALATQRLLSLASGLSYCENRFS